MNRRTIITIQTILFFSGCNNKVVQWGQETFKQTYRYNQTLQANAAFYIRSYIVYEQMQTMATFVALYLTDEIRMMYADYYKQRHFIDADKEALMKQRLLNENKYYISFYVIGSQPETVYPDTQSLFSGASHKNGSLLGNKDAEWQLSLLINNVEYHPDSIRVVELPIEYQYLFANHFSQFKSIYLVKFDAFMNNHTPLLSPGEKHTIALKLRSALFNDVLLEWKDFYYSLPTTTN